MKMSHVSLNVADKASAEVAEITSTKMPEINQGPDFQKILRWT